MSADPTDQALVPRFRQHHILVYVSEFLIRKDHLEPETRRSAAIAHALLDINAVHVLNSVIDRQRVLLCHTRGSLAQVVQPYDTQGCLVMSDEQRRSADIHLRDLGLHDHRRTLPTPILHMIHTAEDGSRSLRQKHRDCPGSQHGVQNTDRH